jgi:hypothetical protein
MKYNIKKGVSKFLLYTTKQIADLYGVSTYKVTQNWCKHGLKHTPEFEYKKEWVDEFLEELAVQNVFHKHSNFSLAKSKNFKNKKFIPITIEDLM